MARFGLAALQCAMLDLQNFDIDSKRGFLPAADPLQLLPQEFNELERLAADLPKLFASNKLRSEIETRLKVPVSKLQGAPQVQRAMMLISYLGHGYAWGEPPAPTSFPAALAIPWYEISKLAGRPPSLSYESYALVNWRRLDPNGPITLGNIALLQNFLGGIDEEWFILVHVDIEAKAGDLLTALADAVNGAENSSPEAIEKGLTIIDRQLEKMYDSLSRMPEHCDPYIYYNRVRPYIHGWKNNPAVPNGIVYEGVTAYGNAPQMFRGETGSQSSIIPALDAALGIQHQQDLLRTYLVEMREYMPPRHRAFIEMLESSSKVRQVAAKHRDSHPGTREAYNRCVNWIEKFRTKHLSYAFQYIDQQNQQNIANPNKVGTGGTPFITYLKKHRDETATHLL